MTIKVTYSQFLISSGVDKNLADAIADGINNKLMRRQGLSPDEASLSDAFLKRRGANTIAEQPLAEASARVSKIDAIAVKCPTVKDEVGDTIVYPANWKGFSLDGKSDDVLSEHQIRDLANRVNQAHASDPEWRYVPVRRFAS